MHMPLFAEMAEPEALAPSTYLLLRRRTAGLTAHEAAAKLAPTNANVDRAASLIRHLETPGRKALFRSTIDDLQRAFSFDPSVYWQLADEHVDHHPRVCRTCGCSQDDACASADGHTACSWSTPLSCSRCAPAPAFAA